MLSNCSILCLFKLAKYLAWIVANTKNQISGQTRINIQSCFPLLTDSQKKSFLKDSLHHTSCAFFELAAIWNHPINDVLNLITTHKINDSFFTPDKAKIIIAPHHGSWELLNLWLANEGPLYSLYKPARSKKVDQYVFKKRSRNKAILVPSNTSGLRKLLQGLKNNASCMILPDQRPAIGTAQINSSFFNNQVPTSLLIKRLASKVDCNIFIASITRNLKTGEYQLIVDSLKTTEFLSCDLKSATYLNKSIETFIVNTERQYQWAYRRF